MPYTREPSFALLANEAVLAYLDEERVYISPAPAGVAQILPSVVDGRCTTTVVEAIDGAAAAKASAT